MILEKLRMGFIFSIAFFLSACGAGLDCNQKDFEAKISNMTHERMLTISDFVEPYWTFSLQEKLAFSVSDIKEIGQSENGKSKTCEATLITNLPPLSEQPPAEFRILLMSIKDQLKLGGGQSRLEVATDAINQLAGNEENLTQVSTPITYTVSKVEKSSSGDPIEIKFEADDVQNIVGPVIYRMYQTIFLDLAKFKLGSYNPTDKDKNKTKSYLDTLKKELSEAKNLPENEKTIRFCTIKNITDKTTLDAYLGLEVIFDVFYTKNKVAVSAFGSIFDQDGLPKHWIQSINEARVSCGGGVPTQ